MPKKVARSAVKYIMPLNINGLEGRMLRLPSPATKQAGDREILCVYGHHSTLERWEGLLKVLNRYGAVTMADLPGFGGMDSFFRIHKKPTLDNMADYLAAFVKLRYRRKRLMIVGIGFGFIVATRMLQMYPRLTRKVTLVVSVEGFARYDDLTIGKKRRFLYLAIAKLSSYSIPATIFRYSPLKTMIIKSKNRRYNNKKFKNKLEPASQITKDQTNRLWQNNDMRTWAYTNYELLKLDNCKVKINLPVYHVSANKDQLFDLSIVEQHMRIIFNSYEDSQLDMNEFFQGESISEQEVVQMFPVKLRRYILKNA